MRPSHAPALPHALVASPCVQRYRICPAVSHAPGDLACAGASACTRGMRPAVSYAPGCISHARSGFSWTHRSHMRPAGCMRPSVSHAATWYRMHPAASHVPSATSNAPSGTSERNRPTDQMRLTASHASSGIACAWWFRMRSAISHAPSGITCAKRLRMRPSVSHVPSGMTCGQRCRMRLCISHALNGIAPNGIACVQQMRPSVPTCA